MHIEIYFFCFTHVATAIVLVNGITARNPSGIPEGFSLEGESLWNSLAKSNANVNY